MKQNTFDKKDGMLKKHSKKKFWKKVVAMLSCVTVFCTSYTMIMPAMTMSETTYCGQEEGENHTHTLQCYSNPNADLETEANWTATIPTLTGNWNEDVVALANSQLGYQESTANYQVADNNEKKGYNRYGAWMNEPYADWNTDFVLFCLHYANVDTSSLSLSNDLSAWASNSAYVTKDSYTPKAGDLIILDENNDGSADHAAIITEANGSAIKIVEGDYSNAVGQENYDTTDARVVGYIQMPSNPAMPELETPEETAAPVETSAPEETAQPEPTATPEATEPAETAEPQETVEPEMTAAPEESSAEAAVPAAPSASKRMMPKIFRAPAANTTVDITGNLTSATIKIDGQDVTGDTWNVKANKSYAITLHFKENSNSQFPDDDRWMTYPIPQGLIIDDMTKTFDMVINKGELNEKTIHGNTMVVDKEHGLIKFKWNKEDHNFAALQNSDNAHIDADISGSFDSDTTKINFGGSVTRTIKVDSTHNASVYKSGQYNPNDGKIHYTVTVNSTGTSENVVVTDTISGTALKYDQDQKVNITSTKGATATTEPKGNGFTATIPSMSDGEQVKFEYTASVDLDKLGQSGTVDQDKTSNGVNISCPGDKDEGDNSATQFVNYISFSSLGKNAQSVGNTYPENGKTYRDITWTINANEERKKHITYISDSISKDSQDIMTYSGNGLTIVVTKENGTQETRDVPWNDIKKTKTGWTYTPPEDDGNASYQVTYTTKADVTNLIDSRNVSNGATTDYSSATGSATVGPSGENQFNASKKATAVSSDKVTWEITVDVPASGLDKLVVTDTLPTQYVNNHNVYDYLLDKEITVTGLDGSEDYSPDTSDPSKFVLKFYKDKAHNNAGMNSSGKKRTVTISYTTTVNKEWVEYSGQHKEEAYLMTHTNNANVSVPGIDKGIEAQVTITNSEQTIKKEEVPWDKGMYTDADGTIWQYYSYNIILSGATEDNLTLEDTFDKKYLKYFDGTYDQWGNVKDGANCIYGGDQYGQNSGRQKVTVQETPTGIKINTGTLPRQNNGTFYSYYRIHYYLKAKLDDLQKLAAKEGGMTTLRNSVKWGTQNATADVTYTYPGVDKKCDYNTTTKTASYTITINPSAIEMNKGQPMQLEDTFTHQMIDYSSIKIAAHDATGKVDRSKEVTYSLKDGKLVFSIPDSTFICITYDAKPSGASGDVKMTNTADLLSYHKETSAWAKIDGSAGGGGTTTGLRLFKYEKNNMRVPLTGAVFQLLDADRKVLTYNTGENNGKPITFTTDSDGYVEIQLSSSTGYTGGLQKGTKYFLRETDAPAGYQKTEDVPFTISTDGTYNHSENLYANGETILVEDKKITKVSITLKKVDSGNNELTLPGAVFDLYGSDYAINTSAKAIKTNRTTGTNGTVDLGPLESGTYYLVETTAPDGYGVISKPIKVVVTDEKVTIDQGTGIKEVDVSDVSGTKTAEITVADDKVYTLPATGGAGTTMIYVVGGVLVAVAVVMFVMQKRKRG